MAARKLRHEFFARTAKERKIRVIALAHHADDQVELFFLRILRGAGGEGLAGMKWRSPSPVDSKIMLVRPLLDAAKAELRGFARENKIHFREDATNAFLDMPRNRVRHELLPLLRRCYQPALIKTVSRLMEIVGAEAEFVGETARQWLGSSRGNEAQTKRAQGKTEDQLEPPHVGCYDFAGLPVAVQRRVLQLQLSEAGVPADFELIESLRQSADVPVSLSTELSVLRDATGAINLRLAQRSDFNAREMVIRLAGRAGDVEFDGRKFLWALKKYNGSRGSAFARLRRDRRSPHQTEFFDADKVGGKITLRHWRPGDRFQPIGLKSAAKLQDLFTNAKIPRARRRGLTVALAENGEIFWVEGLRISENFKLTLRTKRWLDWRWRHLIG
jgi:tRNA(Ile)-lysidine synthase